MSKSYTQDPPKVVQVSEDQVAWEAERSQLRTKIVQLEHALVDAIERSNNPLRARQLSEEKILLIEEAKREWTAQWNIERNQLTAEIQRLRKLAASILSCDMTALR